VCVWVCVYFFSLPDAPIWQTGQCTDSSTYPVAYETTVHVAQVLEIVEIQRKFPIANKKPWTIYWPSDFLPLPEASFCKMEWKKIKSTFPDKSSDANTKPYKTNPKRKTESQRELCSDGAANLHVKKQYGSWETSKPKKPNEHSWHITCTSASISAHH
jgi:hypothetical protein